MQKIKLILVVLFVINAFVLPLRATTIDCQKPPCFKQPLELPMNLSAGFGEVRPRHFHAGLDIRTNQKMGFNVKAIADGYVSRVMVKTGGYGNAIYITHPNGYMSIYAHLKSFNDQIADYVYNEQYKRKSFSVNLYPHKNAIKIKQGEVIGLSGNSGSSGGPHLHFEMRDKYKADVAINPFLLGYSTNDSIAPTLTKLVIYKVSEDTNIDNNTGEYEVINIVPDKTKKNVFKLSNNKVINVNGPISLGIAAFDMPNSKSLKTSPYSIQLLVDNNEIFAVSFDKVSYSVQKMANTYLDYGIYLKNRIVVHKSFLDKGNKFDNYSKVINKGVLYFTDNKKHKLKYIVKDFANNTSILEFSIMHNKELKRPKIENKEGIFLAYNKARKIETDDLKINFAKDSFYNDVWLTQSKSKAPENAFSDLYTICSKFIPLNKSFKLSIKPNKDLPNPDKALIVNKNGRSVGGAYKNGYVSTFIGSFDSFYVSEDTKAPTITPSSINHQGIANDNKSISFKISDNLSGIKSFNGYINNKWVLFQYEPKTGIISYYFDKYMPKNQEVKLKVIVVDNKNNSSAYERILTRSPN